ncbi:MAG: fibronectin type III domain-containing protein, partial [Myxococcota bacterium]|nr:fibronectin type III domain-containing protein [Myxococcota bacterium]
MKSRCLLWAALCCVGILALFGCQSDSTGDLVEEPVADETAPTWLEGSTLSALQVGADQVTLVWSSAEDDTGVHRYHVAQDGEVVMSTAGATGVALLEGLDPAREYTFSVEAEDEAGNVSTGGPTLTLVTGDEQPPAWPDGSEITASNISSDSLSLAWTESTDDVAVTAYVVSMDGQELQVLSATTTTFEVQGLSPWTEYTFGVEAEDGAGNRSDGGPSVDVQTGDESAPVWPDGTEVTAVEVTASSLVLLWGAASDDVNVTGYEILQDGAQIALVDGNAGSFLVEGLSPWTDYTFQVEALDAASNLSTTGPSVTVKTHDEVAPLWPEDATLAVDEVTSTSLNLTWSAAQDDVGVTAYRVFQSGVEVALVADGSTAVTVTGLSPWTDYSFQVEAEDAAANLSEQGPVTSAKTGDEVVPTWPEDAALLLVAASPHEVTLAWPPAQDDVAVTGYRVYQDEVQVALVEDGSTALTVSGLSPWSEYSFRVEAHDAAENLSITGPVLSMKTPDEVSPGWDEGAAIVATDLSSGGVTLEWAAATDDVAVTAYQISQNGALVATLDGAVTTHSVTGLSPWTDYVFQVQAQDEAGNLSQPGLELSVQTLDEQVPTWPEEAKVTGWDVGATSMLLWWSEAMDDVGVTGYRIYRDGVEMAVIGADTTAWPVTGLSPWTTYEFRVEAEDAAGNLSADGPVNTIQTGDEEPPSWPQDATVSTTEVTPESLVVAWPLASDDVAVTGYRVYLDGELSTEVGADEQEATVANLSPWTEYVVRIEALDEAGNLSDTGPVATLMTGDDVEPSWPSVSSLVVGEVTGTTIAIAWTPAVDDVGVTGYQVSVGEGDVASVGPGILQVVLSDLLSGVTYPIAVEAVDGAGNVSVGGPSTTVTTPDIETPEWPDGGALEELEVTPTSVTFGWSDATDNVGVVAYHVYRDGELVHTTEPEVLEYKDWGLEPLTAYDYAVEAIDAAGLASTDGPEATFETEELLPPPDPSEVAPIVNLKELGTFADTVRFLFEGDPPIQTGVPLDAIRDQAMTVVHGRVLTPDGQPVSLVEVSIEGHPEYGKTLTRLDGEFDMAVNGGGDLMVLFKKSGVLPARRLVETMVKTFARVDDVVMVPLDGKVTVIDLFGSDELQVAQGTEVVDEDGARTATVMVPAGTGAEMVLGDGSTVPLTTVSLRATEYTVGDSGPAAMPADLPPTSAYTYAVELSVDEALEAGALEVRFDQTLSFYLDNFLGLPAGVRVPVGYLDQRTGAWVPSLDGVVVEVLEISDGVAVLDLEGEDEAATPEQLALAGVSEAELAKVAELYEVGDTLWRVQMDHFTPWDCNFPYVPPADAVPPDMNMDDLGPEVVKPDDDCEASGSVIGLTERSLSEHLNMSGVPISLSYKNTRSETYQAARRIRVPLTRESIPASLKRIDVHLSIGGQDVSKSFDPSPNLIGEILWDGRDRYGRVVARSRRRNGAAISYVYSGEYAETRDAFEQGFSRTGDLPLCGTSHPFKPTPPHCLQVDRTRKEISLTQRILVVSIERVGPAGIRPFGYGGWTVSEHHQYSPDTGEVFLGHGGRFTGSGIGDSIQGIGGISGVASSDADSLGDGGPATEATLNYPNDMVIAGDGSIYIADTFNHRIRRIGIDGIITTVVGSGEQGGSSGDGGDALDAVLCFPVALDVARDGSIYIVDGGSDRVRRVDPDGIITTVLGGPAVGEEPEGPTVCEYPQNDQVPLLELGGAIPIGGLFGGLFGPPEPTGLDGTFAEDVELAHPMDVVVAPDGRFYVSDGGTNEVLHVGLDGVVEVALGHPTGLCGVLGPCGVGTPGRNISVRDVGSLHLDPAGNLTVLAGEEILTLGADGRLKRSYHPDTFELLAPLVSFFGDASFGTVMNNITMGPDGNLYVGLGDEYAEFELPLLAELANVPGEDLESTPTLSEFIIRLTPDTQAYARSRVHGEMGGGGGGFDPASQKDATLIRVAGVGHSGAEGDGGFALQAKLHRPLGLDFAPDGSLVFLDSYNHSVRKVSRAANSGGTGGLSTLPSLGAVLIPSPDGRTVFEFLHTGRHLSTRDALTGIVLLAFGYDDNGDLVEVTDEDGYVTTIERFPYSQAFIPDYSGGFYVPAHAIVGPFGHKTALKYNFDGCLKTVTSPAGRVTTMGYDTGCLLLSIEDAEGGVTSFSYDENGDFLSETDAAGGVKTLERQDNGSSVAYVLTSPSGRTTTVSVSSDGKGGQTRTTTSPTGAVFESTVRVDGSTRVVYPNGETVDTTLAPDPIAGTRAPLPATRTTTHPDGEETVISLERTMVPTANGEGLFSLLQEKLTVDGVGYNAAYDPTEGAFTWLTPGGSSSTTLLDDEGRVVSYDNDDLSAVVSLGYGDQGELNSFSYGGLTTSLVYGANGRVAEVTSPGGKTVHFSHDADDLLVGLELPSGRAYSYTRDGNGRLTTTEMPNGDIYSVTYTPRGLSDSFTYPHGGTVGTTWTPDGEIEAVTLASGKVIQYDYDSGGRQLGVSAGDVDITMEWEGVGENLVGISREDADGVEAYAYETFNGRPSVTVQTGAMGTDLFSYAYDERGFLSQVSVDLSSGEFISVDRVRDLDGRVLQEGDYSLVTTSSVSKAAGVTDGVMEALSQFDGAGRLVTRSLSVADAVFYDAQYSLSADDLLTQVIEDVDGLSTLMEYVYDDDSQLLEVYRDEVLEESYAYDLNGNRISKNVSGVVETATFEAGDRIVSQGDVSYTVDDDGFVVSRTRPEASGDDTFSYTARGELVYVDIADGESISYTYDALGRRLSRTGPEGTERYLYADISNLGLVTHVVRPDGALFALFYDESGRLYAMESASGSEIYYIATDRLGSPRVVVDFNGVTQRLVTYSAFGEVLSDSAPDFFLPIGFAGGLADNLTGLVRMGARDYDPVTGRWMAPDP